MFDQNNLSQCTSPYLNQHQDNPVHWQPWSEEVLEHAKKINKPVLVSIGYSACHWCHVMARESFNDVDTANILNEHFVNVKIDAEERPDLDRYFQQAHQILNQRSGGWPLNVFLDPQSQLPFFVGTYFPLEPQNGVASFQQILASIHDIYANKPKDVTQISQQLIAYIKEFNTIEKAEYDCEADAKQLLTSWIEHHDSEWGGLKGAPKFPQTILLHALLNALVSTRPDNGEALYKSIMLSIQSICRIGLNDHLGGGFFRYCIDHYWGVPHFEKMLYDNALLIDFIADLVKFNKEGYFAHVAQQAADWSLNTMRSESGGFFSTMDADLNQKEGAYYTFSKTDVQSKLTEEEWKIAEKAFGFEQAPNVGDRWHLHQWYSPESLAEKLGLPLKQVQWQLEPIKQKLLEQRSQQPLPHRDKKIITSWNALLIKALYKLGINTRREDYIVAAQNALAFLHQQVWKEGQLYRCVMEKHSYQSAMLDDYAHLCEALLCSLEYEWNDHYFTWLQELAQQVTKRFLQGNCALKFSESKDLPTSIYWLADDAMPNPTSSIATVFVKLSAIDGVDRHTQIKQLLEIKLGQQEHDSLSHASLINARLQHKHHQVVVIRGDLSTAMQWKQEITMSYRPYRCVFILPHTDTINSNVNEKFPLNENTYAVICQQGQCSLPIKSLEELNTTL